MSVLLLLLGCNPSATQGGVLVGNPGEVTTKTARSAGLSYLSGSANVSSLSLADCDGSEVAVVEGVRLDLLGSVLLLPDGEWCALRIDFDGPAEWAVSDGADTARLELNPDSLELFNSSGFSTSGAVLTLQLGDEDWLQPEMFSGGDIIDDTELTSLLRESSMLTTGADGEGLIADPFDDASALGEAPAEDVGCNEEVTTRALLLPLLVLGGGLRRRQRPQRT